MANSLYLIVFGKVKVNVPFTEPVWSTYWSRIRIVLWLKCDLILSPASKSQFIFEVFVYLSIKKLPSLLHPALPVHLWIHWYHCLDHVQSHQKPWRPWSKSQHASGKCVCWYWLWQCWCPSLVSTEKRQPYPRSASSWCLFQIAKDITAFVSECTITHCSLACDARGAVFCGKLMDSWHLHVWGLCVLVLASQIQSYEKSKMWPSLLTVVVKEEKKSMLFNMLNFMLAVLQWGSNEAISCRSWTDAVVCKFVCGEGIQQTEMSCN